jgi:CMP-N-acetylneuraminic acid synthetase
MKTITTDMFNAYLRQNGSFEHYYQEVSDMCWVFPYTAKGSLVYQDSLMLPLINKYFLVQIEIVFQNNRRFYKVDLVQEYNIDEFLDVVMQEEEFKESYNELIKYLK